MNEIANKNEKLMTTRELAETLNVSTKTILRAINNLDINVKVENGKPTYLNEIQATAIKLELQNHSKVNASSPKTELEENLLIENAIRILHKRNEELKRQNEIMKPKAECYDNFLARDKFCNFRDAANYLGISQTEFMNKLKSKYIYKTQSGEYRAYSEYTEYFTLRPFNKGYDKVGQQLMLNIKGLEYLKKAINE